MALLLWCRAVGQPVRANKCLRRKRQNEALSGEPNARCSVGPQIQARGVCWLWHREQDPTATSGYKNDFHKWNS